MYQSSPLEEPQPNLTTGQSKVSPVSKEVLHFEEIDIFENGNSNIVERDLIRVEDNVLLDI